MNSGLLFRLKDNQDGIPSVSNSRFKVFFDKSVKGMASQGMVVVLSYNCFQASSMAVEGQGLESVHLCFSERIRTVLAFQDV